MLNNENIFIKVLPKQVCYKAEDGTSSETPLRLGRLTDELYRDRNVINTIYGEEPFASKVEIKIITHCDNKCYLIITISNIETKTTVKQLIIRSQQNDMTLSDMKKIYDEIVSILESESKTIIVDLITKLREKKNITIEEYC